MNEDLPVVEIIGVFNIPMIVSGMSSERLSQDWPVAVVAYGALVLCVLGMAGGILYLNDGRFIYVLDDAYIHLAMSEGIYAGAYGINENEPAAASSSILFPLLFAWASPHSVHEYLPLVINLAAVAASVASIRRFFSEIGFDRSPEGRIYATVLTALIPLSMNLIGLAFTGMENSLQVMLELLVLLGLIRALAHDRIDWWLPVVIVLAPTVRFESTSVSGLALLALAGRGWWKPAIFTALAIVGVLGAFSLFLISLGLSPLPSSVMAHSRLADHAVTGSGALSIIATAIVHFAFNLLGIKGMVLFLAAVGMAVIAFRTNRLSRSDADRMVAIFGMLASAIYLFGGQISRYHRHETAIFTLTILIIVYLARRHILKELDNRSIFRLSICSLAVLAAIGGNFVRGTFVVPVASNNIYEQQYQMHRLITESIRGPVAANDIGWVSYRNDEHVLDLWGLASVDALRARHAGYTPASLERLIKESGAKLIMIYDTWFKALPTHSWKLVGRLYLSRQPIYAAENVVSLYAPPDADVADLRAKLGDFAKTLPRGVTLDLL